MQQIFFSAKYGAIENQFWTAEYMCIVVVQFGEGAQTHSRVLYGRNCAGFFLSDMLRFAKQSKKKILHDRKDKYGNIDTRR